MHPKHNYNKLKHNFRHLDTILSYCSNVTTAKLQSLHDSTTHFNDMEQGHKFCACKHTHTPGSQLLLPQALYCR